MERTELIRLSTLKQKKNSQRVWPARLDPFYSFAGYSTQSLTSEIILGLVDDDLEDIMNRVQQLRNLAMVNFAEYVLPSEEETKSIISMLQSKALPMKHIVSNSPLRRQPFMSRSLVWLVKIGVF